MWPEPPAPATPCGAVPSATGFAAPAPAVFCGIVGTGNAPGAGRALVAAGAPAAAAGRLAGAVDAPADAFVERKSPPHAAAMSSATVNDAEARRTDRGAMGILGIGDKPPRPSSGIPGDRQGSQFREVRSVRP